LQREGSPDKNDKNASTFFPILLLKGKKQKLSKKVTNWHHREVQNMKVKEESAKILMML
jgi:hypothetical protein